MKLYTRIGQCCCWSVESLAIFDDYIKERHQVTPSKRSQFHLTARYDGWPFILCGHRDKNKVFFTLWFSPHDRYYGHTSQSQGALQETLYKCTALWFMLPSV